MSVQAQVQEAKTVNAKLQALAGGLDLLLGRRPKQAPGCATPVVESVDVRRVFEAWQQATGRRMSKLDPARRQKVQARLKEGYSVERIIRAIEGCAGSDFHMARGKYKGERKFNDLTLICRSGSKLEEFEQMGQRPEDNVLAGLKQLMEYAESDLNPTEAFYRTFGRGKYALARSEAGFLIRLHGSVAKAIEAREKKP